MLSSVLLIDIIMALGVESVSNRNEYQEYFLGVKTAGNLTALV
jgi:hypothetical protein